MYRMGWGRQPSKALYQLMPYQVLQLDIEIQTCNSCWSGGMEAGMSSLAVDGRHCSPGGAIIRPICYMLLHGLDDWWSNNKQDVAQEDYEWTKEQVELHARLYAFGYRAAKRFVFSRLTTRHRWMFSACSQCSSSLTHETCITIHDHITYLHREEEAFPLDCPGRAWLMWQWNVWWVRRPDGSVVWQQWNLHFASASGKPRSFHLKTPWFCFTVLTHLHVDLHVDNTWWIGFAMVFVHPFMR